MCILVEDLVIISPTMKQSSVLQQITGKTNAARGILKDDEGTMVSQGCEVPQKKRLEFFILLLIKIPNNLRTWGL